MPIGVSQWTTRYAPGHTKLFSFAALLHMFDFPLVFVVMWLVWRLIRRFLIDYTRLKKGVVVVTGA